MLSGSSLIMPQFVAFLGNSAFSLPSPPGPLGTVAQLPGATCQPAQRMGWRFPSVLTTSGADTSLDPLLAIAHQNYCNPPPLALLKHVLLPFSRPASGPKTVRKTVPIIVKRRMGREEIVRYTTPRRWNVINFSPIGPINFRAPNFISIWVARSLARHRRRGSNEPVCVCM